MMRCEHENADHLMPGQLFARSHLHLREGTPVLVEQFRCLDCGAWLSLGASNDKPRAVRIEIRAVAIIAEHVNTRGRLGLTGNIVEIDGWCAHNTDVDDHHAKEPAFQSGYLARAIVEHVEPIADLIARSSIGAGRRDIEERGIDAHLADLEKEMG